MNYLPRLKQAKTVKYGKSQKIETAVAKRRQTERAIFKVTTGLNETASAALITEIEDGIDVSRADQTEISEHSSLLE